MNNTMTVTSKAYKPEHKALNLRERFMNYLVENQEIIASGLFMMSGNTNYRVFKSFSGR